MMLWTDEPSVPLLPTSIEFGRLRVRTVFLYLALWTEGAIVGAVITWAVMR
jgi:hypothetical protein